MVETNPYENIIPQRVIPDAKAAPPKKPKTGSDPHGYIDFAKTAGPLHKDEFDHYVDFAKKAGKPATETSIEELYAAHKHAGEEPVMREEKNRVDERGREEMKRSIEFEEEDRYEEIRKIAQEILDGRKAVDPGITREIPTTTDMEMAEKIYERKLQQSADAAKLEYIQQAELNQVINGLTAKAVQIENVKKQKGRKFSSLAKSLGIRTRSLENDEEIIALKKESDDLYQSLMAKGIRLYWNDKEQLANFMRQYGDKEEFFLNLTNEALDIQVKNAGLPEKAVNYFYKIGKKWSELKKWQQIAIGATGGLLTAGGALAVGAGTFGALALTGGYRWGFRGFGAMAMGIGRKIKLEKQRKQERDAGWENTFNEQMDTLKRYEHDLDVGIALVVNKKSFSEIGKDYEEQSLQNTRQAMKLAGKTFIISSLIGESLRLGGQYTGINIGTILKKIGGVLGMEGGGAEWQPEMSKGSPATSESGMKFTRIMDGYPEAEGHEDIVKSTHERYGYGKYGPEGYGTEAEGHIPESQTEASSPRAADAPERIARPKNILLGFDDVKRGGGIEKSAQAIMRQDPEQFGFDPKDPKLNAKIGQKAHLLARDMAKNMGFEGKEGLEEFNKIASQRVQEGDQISLFRKPSGELGMEYSGSAFGEVSAPGAIPETEISASKASGIASAEEIAGGGKAGVAPEEMKPKAGAGVAEQQPSRVRGAGKMKLPDEILENERIAKENFAKASRYAEDVAKWKAEAGPQIEQMRIKAALAQVGPTRGLLNNIVTEAGIGRKGYFWGQPISKFNDLVGENLFAGEASEPDAVGKINSNKDKLRRLYEILKEYSVHGGETMDECLRKALLNSTPIIEGKRGESVGSRILQLINQKVLGK